LGDVFYFGDKGGAVLIAFPAKPKVVIQDLSINISSKFSSHKIRFIKRVSLR